MGLGLLSLDLRTARSVSNASDLITIAGMIFGFGIVVVMFRVQRELWVQEHQPDWPNWTPWEDWLILATLSGRTTFSMILTLGNPKIVPNSTRRWMAKPLCLCHLLDSGAAWTRTRNRRIMSPTL